MPKYMIWIRKEDNDKWLALKSRAEFIHNALNHIAPENAQPIAGIDSAKILEETMSPNGFAKPHKTYFKKDKK